MTAINVIIPFYNSAKTLPGTLESIRRQTFGDWKILAVNDGSSDDSAQIVEKLAAEDPRIVLINKPNGGVASARNCGLDHSESEFVFFLDSDDYLHPQALAILHRIATASGAQVVECAYADTKIAFEDYQPLKLYEETSYQVCRAPLCSIFERKKDFTPTIWNKLYRREAIGNLRYPDCCIFEDIAFSTCLAANLTTAMKIDLPLVNYFNANTSLTRSSFSLKKIKSYGEGIDYVQSYFLLHRKQDLPRLKREFFSWYVRVMINSVKKCRNTQDNYRELEEALAHVLHDLYHRKIIGFAGLSWGKKLSLLKLLVAY